jgi:6-phosphogluconate dehydrogenase
MQVGIVGLGRIGAGMARRLARGGHEVVAWNRTTDVATALAAEPENGGHLTAVASVQDLVAALVPPRHVLLSLPAGDVTQALIDEIAPLLAPGDVLVDTGNANFRDSARRGETLAARNLTFLDMGVSGGVWGLEVGFCAMVGGDRAAFERLEPAIATLAPPNGYLYCGPAGAGHYVKMVHNAIEYGLMQAYAEGFELMHESPYGLDLGKIATLWTNGSVVRSWLLELAARALEEDRDLSQLEGRVDDSGEGRWTLHEAIERAVPMPATTAALFTRFRSRTDNPFAERLLAALRQQFGGHAVKASK